MSAQPRIGVVGATGAVGTVTLALLAERGYENVRAFASARSAGSTLPFGDDELVVEEATPEALGAGDVDLFLFSVGTSASRELVPVASAAGAICVDKSSAYRLVDGYPLVVPEVNGAPRARGARARPDRRQPELLHDPAHLRPEAAPRRGRAARACASRRTSRSRARARSGWTRSRDEAPADARPRDGLDVGGRRVGRGGEAPRRDAQDPRASRPADLRDLRARAGHGRPLGGGLDRARAAARARGGRRDPPRRPERPRPRPSRRSRRRPPPPARTRCSSAASGATRRRRTASRSTSRATTSARAPRSTRSRSRSCCSMQSHARRLAPQGAGSPAPASA